MLEFLLEPFRCAVLAAYCVEWRRVVGLFGAGSVIPFLGPNRSGSCVAQKTRYAVHVAFSVGGLTVRGEARKGLKILA